MRRSEKRLKNRLIFLAAVFSILLVVDVTGYILIENVSLIDAVYMTFISITTVGYREVFSLSVPARFFTIFVIITGIGVFLAFADAIIENALEGRIRKILGRRKMKKNLFQLKGHVVVAGYGRMGATVCTRLKSMKMAFVIIENSPERFALGEERELSILSGDATDEEMLKVAGIDKAGYFLSLLSSDSDNMLAILTVRELNPSIKIITRSFDPVNEKRLRRIGADGVISPYDLSSARIVSTVIKPNVVDFFDIVIDSPQLSLSLEELKISEDSELSGKRIRDSFLREKYNAIVVAVKRGDTTYFNPSPDFNFAGEDILIVLGERQKIQEIH